MRGARPRRARGPGRRSRGEYDSRPRPTHAGLDSEVEKCAVIGRVPRAGRVACVATNATLGRVPLAGLAAYVETHAALGRVPVVGLVADAVTSAKHGRVLLAGQDADVETCTALGALPRGRNLPGVISAVVTLRLGTRIEDLPQKTHGLGVLSHVKPGRKGAGLGEQGHDDQAVGCGNRQGTKHDLLVDTLDRVNDEERLHDYLRVFTWARCHLNAFAERDSAS